MKYKHAEASCARQRTDIIFPSFKAATWFLWSCRRQFLGNGITELPFGFGFGGTPQRSNWSNSFLSRYKSPFKSNFTSTAVRARAYPPNLPRAVTACCYYPPPIISLQRWSSAGCAGRTWQSNSKKRHFTAFRRILFPLGQRAASLLTKLVVKQGQGREILWGENGPAQVEQREGHHNNSPAGRVHVSDTCVALESGSLWRLTRDSPIDQLEKRMWRDSKDCISRHPPRLSNRFIPKVRRDSLKFYFSKYCSLKKTKQKKTLPIFTYFSIEFNKKKIIILLFHILVYLVYFM